MFHVYLDWINVSAEVDFISFVHAYSKLPLLYHDDDGDDDWKTRSNKKG